MDPRSVLLITLDSCRYDSFAVAKAPRMKSIGPLYRAMAPSHFTFGSHASIFVGSTPGVPDVATPYVNPKFAKIFKLANAGFPGINEPFIALEGRNIIHGFKNKGFATLGSGAVGWFDPETATGAVLAEGFDEFFYPGNSFSLDAQLAWAQTRLRDQGQRPVFLFLNIGETHVPYFFKGADWDPDYNPCVPFSSANDGAECRRRQIDCIEFIDAQLADLLKQFGGSTIVICSDHGDCWGEDGIWEHGVSHPKVFEVPLLFQLAPAGSIA
jgi:Sulfatase